MPNESIQEHAARRPVPRSRTLADHDKFVTITLPIAGSSNCCISRHSGVDTLHSTLQLGWPDTECGEHNVIGHVSALLGRIDVGVGEVRCQRSE